MLRGRGMLRDSVYVYGILVFRLAIVVAKLRSGGGVYLGYSLGNVLVGDSIRSGALTKVSSISVEASLGEAS